jgi:MFS family permease
MIYIFGFSTLIFSNSLNFLLIAIIIVGLGIGILSIIIPAILMDETTSSQRGIVSGVRNMAWGLGYFIDPVLGAIMSESFVVAPFLLCIITSCFGIIISLFGSKKIKL